MADQITPVAAPAAVVDPTPAPAPAVAPAASPAPASVASPTPVGAPATAVQPVPTEAPVPAVAPVQAPVEVYQPVHADPRVHGVESMLAEKGLTAQQVHDVFAKALETQDVKDVDVVKLKEHLGEAGAKLAMQNLEAFSADVARAAKTLYDTAVGLTGGEESYKQFSEWVQTCTEGALGAEVQELRQALARGGRLAYLALDSLNTTWRKHSQHAVGAAALITPDGGSATPSVQPFSNRREYVNAMKEAHKTKDATKIAAVNARYAARPV